MVDRIATLTGHNKTLRHITTVQNDLAKVTQQISSGKIASSYSELNGVVERVSTNGSKINRIDSYISNNASVKVRLQTMDKSLDQIQKALEEFSSTMVLRKGASTSEQMNFQGIADSQLDKIKAALNTSVEGIYIFSGTKSDIKPVKDNINLTTNGVADKTYYQGNSEVLKARISDNRNIEYGVRAEEEGFQQAIAAIVTAMNEDGNADPNFEDATALLEDAINNVADIRARVNADLTTVEDINSEHQAMKIYWKQAVSEDVDTDIAEASIKLSSDQTILQATYQTFALMSGLKLTDFLR